MCIDRIIRDLEANMSWVSMCFFECTKLSNKQSKFVVSNARNEIFLASWDHIVGSTSCSSLTRQQKNVDTRVFGFSGGWLDYCTTWAASQSRAQQTRIWQRRPQQTTRVSWQLEKNKKGFPAERRWLRAPDLTSSSVATSIPPIMAPAKNVASKAVLPCIEVTVMGFHC